MYYGDDDDDECRRFKFEQKGSNQLIVFGINPSTAQGITSRYASADDDQTIKRVKSFAERNGYDGFLMLNVCAQRCTNPNDLSKTENKELLSENVKKIAAYLQERNAIPVLLAFGNNISKRKQLLENFQEIISILNQHNPTYYHLGTLTEKHNPRQPSRLAKHTELILFQKGDGNGKWDFLFS